MDEVPVTSRTRTTPHVFDPAAELERWAALRANPISPLTPDELEKVAALHRDMLAIDRPASAADEATF